MTRALPLFCVLSLVGLSALSGCGLSDEGRVGGLNGAGTGTTGGSSNQPNESSPDTGIVDGNGEQTPADDSVADVTSGGNGSSQGSGQPLPKEGIAARVRNESAFQADVTLRFISADTVVHLAFVRVLANTVTMIVSPEPADLLELSGVDERGGALPRAVLVYGVDFDESTPAEYVIPADPSGDSPPGPAPGDSQSPSITMLEPDDDLSLTLGSTLRVRWTDASPSAGAVVRILLRPAGSTSADDLVPFPPAVGAALDGINDELVIVLEGLEPGLYEVVGEIDDGTNVVTSSAPGRLRIVEGNNALPSLTITSPREGEIKELHEGDVLAVEWTDKDEDDNAVITFALAESEPTGLEPFLISPPLAEDPDEDGADTALLTVSGVLPGLYDLVGTIDDGQALGTARVEGVIRVLEDSDGENDPPRLDLIEPATDIEIRHGESFRVTWSDSDDNDNARISLLLDPHPASGSPDRDEVLLVSSLDEDDALDEITLGVPGGVEKGAYLVKGQITDGVETMVTWAEGIVYFGVAAAANPRITLTEPSSDIRTRLGETIPVSLETSDVPEGSEVRFYVSNLAFGGTERRDVTALVGNGNTELLLPSLPGNMPVANNAWPRRFNLEAEVMVNGTLYTTVAPGSIWIRQEVEITDVAVNYTCPGGEPLVPGGRQFVGVELTWYGGGFEERETHAEVVFWLSGDGTVPPDGVEDSRHIIVHRAPESPNMEQVAQLPRTRILPPAVSEEEGLNAGLEPGQYWLMTIVEPEGFATIISPPHPDPVDVCFRSPDPRPD